MKKIVFGILVISSLLYCSCKSGSDDSSSNGENYIYEVPAGSTSVSFPSEANGKKAFAIYLNQTEGNITKGTAGIQSNQINDEEYRSVQDNSGMVVYENAIEFEDGFRRSDVQFRLPCALHKQQSSGRSINNTVNYTYSEHDASENGIQTFFAQTGPNTVTGVSFKLIKIGSYCRVWYKNDENDLLDTQLIHLQQKFDDIFIKETQVFGSNAFSSSDGITTSSNTKIDILVYDIRGDNTSGTIMGFFRPLDFWLNTTIDDWNEQNPTDQLPRISNQCQLINIDSKFYANPEKEKDIISTLAHEFTHLLVFCHKYGQETSWFTEMLAMCSEDIFQQFLGLTDNQTSKGRFDTSFNTPWKGFRNWPDEPNSESHLLYANTYAFGAYLMRNYGGINLIHQISTNNYVNEGAITMALQSLGYQDDFNSVLKRFGAVYVYPESSKDYSLNKNVSQTFAGTTYNLTPINLKNYYFLTQNNTTRAAFENYVRNNCYCPEMIIGSNSSGTFFGLKGPTIFKTSYNLTAPIESYGFVVYYLGTIKSGKSYNITPVTNMTTIVCVKD